MKKVLFTTTAIVAMSSGMAFAASHSSGNIGFSGETVVGYNDDIEGGIFQETNIDVKASKDAGNGFMVGGHVRLNLDWAEGAGESNNLEFKNIYVETPVGKLEYADSFDGTGASDTFYNDRDGMAEDMTNGDGHNGLKWSGDLGDFGYAIDAGNLSGNSTVNTGDHYTIGAGATFGDFELGLGWENESHEGAGGVIGVSADFSVAMLSVGASYIDSDVETSTGIAVGYAVTPDLDLSVYYAMNDVAEDAWGVGVEYSANGFAIEVNYDDDGTDAFSSFDASYEVAGFGTLFAGYDEGTHSAVGGAGYVGVEVDVADGITATVAYSDADEIDGPEFKDGTSAFLTLTY